jgi:predicted transposase YdaD
MNDHDHSYKLLFSHPEMIADLLRGYVKEDWVDRVDFSTLEKVSGSYITDDLREREDDVVWRVRFADEWLYVYLLLEFQSTVDRTTATRDGEERRRDSKPGDGAVQVGKEPEQG